MSYQYEKYVRGFLSTSPTLEEFRSFLAGENLLSTLEESAYRTTWKGKIIYDILDTDEYRRYIDVLFSFCYCSVVLFRNGNHMMYDWAEKGKYEYFVSAFRHCSMEKLRPSINPVIGDIIRFDDNRIFDLLVANGYLTDTNNIGSMLKFAILFEKPYIATILLNKGARVEPSHFVAAVESRDINAIRRMLVYGGNVNLADAKGKTPLGAALETLDPKIVEEVLSYGADVNIIVDMIGYSPLMIAAEDFRLNSSVEKIIANGANVNYRTSRGKTALSVAQPKVRDILIAAGATINGKPQM